MLKAAQIMSVAVTLFVGAISVFYLFNPTAAGAANGLNPETAFGTTNIRLLAAPMLMIALTAALGAVKKNWLFLLPGALYFLFTAIIRVVGIFVDGADPSTIRGLVLAVVLFVIAENLSI